MSLDPQLEISFTHLSSFNSLRICEFIDMPLGIMQPSTVPSGFFRAVTISAIAFVMEIFLDFVDYDKTGNNNIPCLEKKMHEEDLVISLFLFYQIGMLAPDFNLHWIG